MQSKEKTNWGQPADWVMALGVLIAVIGLLRLISGIWTPDAAAVAGSGNVTPAVITLVVGLVIAVVSLFFRRK